MGGRPRLPAEFRKQDCDSALISRCHGTIHLRQEPLSAGGLLIVLVLGLGERDLLHQLALSDGDRKVRFYPVVGCPGSSGLFWSPQESRDTCCGHLRKVFGLKVGVGLAPD